MTMKIRLLSFFLLAQITIISLFFYLDEKVVLLNFELAFFAAALVVFSSYQGYKKMIMHSVANDAILDIKDPLDQIEDPYDLYDEEEEGQESMDQKEIKKKLKKDGLKKMIKTAAGHTSWKRIGSYIVLIFVFMGLNNNNMLHIASFLLGLTLGLVVATALGPKLIDKKVKR